MYTRLVSNSVPTWSSRFCGNESSLKIYGVIFIYLGAKYYIFTYCIYIYIYIYIYVYVHIYIYIYISYLLPRTDYLAPSPEDTRMNTMRLTGRRPTAAASVQPEEKNSELSRVGDLLWSELGVAHGKRWGVATRRPRRFGSISVLSGSISALCLFALYLFRFVLVLVWLYFRSASMIYMSDYNYCWILMFYIRI